MLISCTKCYGLISDLDDNAAIFVSTENHYHDKQAVLRNLYFQWARIWKEKSTIVVFRHKPKANLFQLLIKT